MEIRAKQGVMKGLGLFMETWKVHWDWKVGCLVRSTEDEPQKCLAHQAKNFAYHVGNGR
jgi:hypothetical protein